MALIPGESLNQYWEQFSITGFPSGVGISSQVFRGDKMSISSAQLKALQTTAVNLVPAPTTGGGIPVPPQGFAFYPVRLVVEYLYGTTAYTIANADNAFQVQYTGKTQALLSMTVTGLVDQTTSMIACNLATNPGPKVTLANSKNLGLELKLVGTTPALTLGDGTINTWLLYQIVPLF